MIDPARIGRSLPIGITVPSGSFTSLLEFYGLNPKWDVPPGASAELAMTEATTVLAVTYRDGVVMGGDRRATAGHQIAHRRVKKVYQADDYSAVAISGTAGLAIELTKLFQTELEHYEKLEGIRLSLEGKANHLASMVRNQLPLAFQGLVVIPLFCGYDEHDDAGKLFSFDVVGGRYDEQDYATTGSGGSEAKSFLKAKWEAGLDEEAALSVALEALVAAAEEDTATGGPDPKRGIYPNLVTVTGGGYSEVSDDRIAEISQRVLEAR